MGKFCSQCGSPVNGEEKFCTNCGAKIERDTEEYKAESGKTPAGDYAEEQGAEYTEEKAAYAENMPKKGKGKRTAGIIAGVAVAVALVVFILMQCGVFGLTKAEKIKLAKECTIYMGVTADDLLSSIDKDGVKWDVDGDEVEAKIVSEDLTLKFEVKSKDSVEFESVEYAGIEISADMLKNFWELYGSEIFGGDDDWEDDLQYWEDEYEDDWDSDWYDDSDDDWDYDYDWDDDSDEDDDWGYDWNDGQNSDSEKSL